MCVLLQELSLKNNPLAVLISLSPKPVEPSDCLFFAFVFLGQKVSAAKQNKWGWMADIRWQVPGCYLRTTVKWVQKETEYWLEQYLSLCCTPYRLVINQLWYTENNQSTTVHVLHCFLTVSHFIISGCNCLHRLWKSKLLYLRIPPRLPESPSMLRFIIRTEIRWFKC